MQQTLMLIVLFSQVDLNYHSRQYRTDFVQEIVFDELYHRKIFTGFDIYCFLRFQWE
jgi:hypothetical protein